MKSIICTLILFVCAITSVNAQNYQNVVCNNCRGAGGWMTMYGAVACQACRGYGYVSVPVQNTTSFRGATPAIVLQFLFTHITMVAGI